MYCGIGCWTTGPTVGNTGGVGGSMSEEKTTTDKYVHVMNIKNVHEIHFYMHPHACILYQILSRK